MFEKLFDKVSAVVHHKAAPFTVERERFLAHCAQQGFSRTSLQQMAPILLAVAHELRAYPDLNVSAGEIKTAADSAVRLRRSFQSGGNRHYRKRFTRVATRWLSFLGCLHKPTTEPVPFADLIEDFTTWMDRERGLSASTIQNRRWHIERFLHWYRAKKRSISSVRVADVDAYLATCHAKGLSRVTIKIHSNAIRAFLRYAGMQGWCSPSIADIIHGPRIYTQENLPLGPSWDEVKLLISSIKTDHPADIRDRAIIMLFAIYGLRAHEVSRMRLEDIDWEHDIISVPRPKQRRSQTYPLIPVVGEAIVLYLKKVRPTCNYRELFLKLMAPFGPISSKSLYPVVATRMKCLGIKSPHRGPHALRHACATHLIAEGLSLKEIGDHLGHRSTTVTRNYAKVDLPGLREVATFDLGEVL